MSLYEGILIETSICTSLCLRKAIQEHKTCTFALGRGK